YKLHLCFHTHSPFLSLRHKEPECCCMCSSCVRYLNNKPHTHPSLPHTQAFTTHKPSSHTHTFLPHTHIHTVLLISSTETGQVCSHRHPHWSQASHPELLKLLFSYYFQAYMSGESSGHTARSCCCHS